MATPIRWALAQRCDRLPWSRPPEFTECSYPYADFTRIPSMAGSCLKPRIGNRIADREMVDHLSLPGCQVEITVHLLIIERANAGRA